MTYVSPDAVRTWCRELTEQAAELLAHDYRNALYAAALQLEALELRLPPALRFEVREPLQAVRAELERLQRRLDLLLRLARPDPQPWCDAVTLMQDWIELAHVVAQRRRLRLELGVLAAPPKRRLPVPAARVLLTAGLLAAVEAANENDALGVSANVELPVWQLRWCAPRRERSPVPPDARWAPLVRLAGTCGAHLAWEESGDMRHWVCTWPDPPSRSHDAHA